MNIPTMWIIAVPPVCWRRTAAPLAAAVLATLALGGCATFSKDGGFDSVARETRNHLDKDVRWPRTKEEQAKVDGQVAGLLRHALSAEDAVQIALLNNRSLQAAFEELGISEADLVQSGRLPNPRFTLRHAGTAAQYDIEETLSFNVLALLTAPYVHETEKRRFAQAQSSAVAAVVRLANDTRRAFYAAVAARATVHYLEQVKTAAEAGAELARRMVAAGNWNILDQAREQGFYTDAAQRLTHAGWAEDSTREKLLRLMGLPGGQPAVELSQTLPDLPPRIEELPDVERAILENRVDLRLQRLKIEELSHDLGLTKATRFIDVLEAGPTRVLQGASSLPYEHGYEISLEIPIFDGGAPRVKRAEAVYSQAVDRFAQAAMDARSQIREAYAAYRASFDIARQQRDEVVPARKAIAAENLRRYNASLISVFDLLSDARGEIASFDDYIQSVRDFWIAKSQLDGAMLGDSSP
jgi:outer membrane protein TolC